MSTPLPFLREIDSAITRSTGRRRAEMVRQLTDLYLVNADQYSDDEIALIDDVFVRLVATIEESARALLAIRLGPYAKAPPKILGILACEDAIDIASPVLIQGERLDEATLIECAKTKKSGASPGDLAPKDAEQAGHRRSRRARRPAGGLEHGEERRSQILQRRIRNSGQSLERR